MRAATFALVAAIGAGACKIDLDSIEFKDAPVSERLCKVSTTAQVCLTAEAEQHSDFAWLQDNMFSTNCSGDDCHGAGVNGQPPAGKLRLAKGFAYASLVGQASELTTDHKLVEPTAPERSYLMFILRGLRADEGVPPFTPPPDDIGYMPQKNNTLCCQKLDAVSRWIAAGALP